MASPSERAHAARLALERSRLALIVAIAANGTIGAGAGLPWRLPADLKRFRAVTTGHAIVMGRRTWDSIGHMTLIAALESAFGIVLDTDDITAFSSYKKGFEIMSKYGVRLTEN